LGTLIQSQYSFLFPEFFCGGRKIHKLCGNTIFISIDARKQKLWHNKPKNKGGRASQKNKKKSNSQKKIQTLYFSICESLIHSI